MEETSPKKEEKLNIEKKDVWEKAKEEFSLLEKEKTEKFPVEEEEAIKEHLKEEIEMMKLTPELQDEAAKKANKIEFLGEKEKLEHLMTIARERGLAFAVNVAKSMNDPYVLDIFHDILIKEGFYKKFIKQ